MLAVCGHIHDGRGAERITWDLESHNVAYQEKCVTRWEDPGQGNKKICLVDLTGRKAPSLANDGSRSVDPSNIQTSPSKSQGQITKSELNEVTHEAIHGTLGLGGNPSSPRSDQEALRGRLGRQETCVVNAALMKSRYPHPGGKKLNKPIVVDLDLPVWEEQGT